MKVLPGVLQPLMQVPAYLLRYQITRDAIAWWSKNSRLVRSIVGTTQAIDVIHGGIKFNALPEHAWAAINHRVSVTR
jgi:hypothetical protein